MQPAGVVRTSESGEQQPLIEYRRSPVIGTIDSLVARPGFFDSASRDQLESMQRMLLRTKSSLHALDWEVLRPLSEKIQSIIVSIDKFHGPEDERSKPGDALDQEFVKKGLVIKRKAPNPQVYIQKNTKVCDVTAYVNANGINLKTMILTSINDELMKIIGLFCTNLEEFVFNMRLDRTNQLLTFKGLINLAALSSLKKLTFNCWNAPFTTQDLNELLKMPSLRKNLTELNIASYVFDDTSLAILSKYEQLQTLSLSSPNITSAGMERFIRSRAAQTTLTTFSAFQGENWSTLISDKFLEGLANCNKLTGLRLDGRWESTDQTDKLFNNVLEKLRDLRVLEVGGRPLTNEGAIAIRFLPLVNLFIWDCSRLEQGEYKLLWTPVGIKVLGMGKCHRLKDLSPINDMSDLLHLTLDLSDARNLEHGINPICDSAVMQRQLQTLCVKGNFPTNSTELGKIGCLKGLHTLRVIDVPKFNDESLKGLIAKNPNIDTYEFNHVSISDHYLGLFNSIIVRNLMLANCFAITKTGLAELLSLPALRNQLVKLSVYNQEMSPTTVQCLRELPKLTVLMAGNPDLPLEDFDVMPNVKERNGVLLPFNGPIIPFDQFNRAV